MCFLHNLCKLTLEFLVIEAVKLAVKSDFRVQTINPKKIDNLLPKALISLANFFGAVLLLIRSANLLISYNT